MKKEDFSNGVKESVALRRFEQNKIPESIHLLIENKVDDMTISEDELFFFIQTLVTYIGNHLC